MTSQVLRHTFGPELTRSGVDIVTVAELMAHASLETTRLTA
jgi:site-specific recombinase XerD